MKTFVRIGIVAIVACLSGNLTVYAGQGKSKNGKAKGGMAQAGNKNSLFMVLESDNPTADALEHEITYNRASVAACDQDGQTPLHLAARLGHQDVIEALLRHRADPCRPDGKGFTPLHMAALAGRTEAITLLLEALDAASGATREHVNAVNIFNQTALHLAALGGNDDCVQLLLPNSDVNAQDNEFRTPLYMAAKRGREQAVEALLERGADCNTLVLPVCVTKKAEQLADVANHKCNERCQKQSGETALHIAAEKGHNLVVKKLLAQPGIDVNLPDSYDQTALHRAADWGREGVVKQLLGAHAKVDVIDAYGNTPLQAAREYSHTEVIVLLEEAMGDDGDEDGEE